MKYLLLILLSFCFLSSIYPQDNKVDKSFFISEWEGILHNKSFSITFINDSISVWKTDSSGYFPEGLELKYFLDLSLYPYKIQFYNSNDPSIPINNLFASLEVIDKNKLMFIGEEATYTNGKIEKPESDEQNIILSRVLTEINLK